MITFKTPKMWIKTISEDGTYAEIVYENILKGMSTTLGNSLRRILLDFIPGMSVTGFTIGNTLKPFKYLVNVVENTVDLTSNFSKIKIKCPEDITRVTLGCIGPTVTGCFKAKDLGLIIPTDKSRLLYNPERHDIKYKMDIDIGGDVKSYVSDEYYTDNVRILNPDLTLFHCATTEPTTLPSVMVNCVQGIYKMSSTEPTKQVQKMGYIPTQVNYSPVVKASYLVTDGSSKLHDNLIIKVKTTGAISPTEAIEQACIILRTNFDLLSYTGSVEIKDKVSKPFKVYSVDEKIDINNTNTEANKSDTQQVQSEVFGVEKSVEQTFIELLNLDDITFNSLKVLGINDIEDLITNESKITNDDKVKIFNSISGSKLSDYTKNEIITVLKDIGFEVKGTDSLLS